MLLNCPNCGKELHEPLKDGISFCTKCTQIFDSSDKNELLSAIWFLRKNPHSLENFIFHSKIADYKAETAFDLAVNQGFSHDEILKIIDQYL